MKYSKRVGALILLSCCICMGKPLQAQATGSSTLELEIKAKQCTLDATTTGLQQSLAINPVDCSQRVSQLLTSQNTINTTPQGYKRIRLSIQDAAGHDEKPSSSHHPALAAPHPPKTTGPQAGNQIPIAVGISFVLALSADVLVFRMYLTQTTLRQLAKVVRFIRSRD